MQRSKLIAGMIAATFMVGVLLIDRPRATAEGPNAAPPFDLTDRSVIEEGARLFGQTCTHYCHGKDGGASRAPKLRGRKLEPDYVYARITKGTPSGMPAFGTGMSEENIWKLVAYVVSVSKAEDQ
jgi:mono/diheme cytochrome c family protein